MNLFYMMATDLDASTFCSSLIPVWTIIGYVIFAIKIVVPLLLIVSGMIALAQAVIKQKEEDIKTAQNLLVKKLIAAVLVYLIITFVGIVVNLVSPIGWKDCSYCAFHPFGEYPVCEYNENGEVVKDSNGDCKIKLDDNGREIKEKCHFIDE